MSRSTIEYVLFDMDGLLIDSERIYTEVTNAILAEHGKEMTWDIKAGLMGKPEREAAMHLLSFFPDLPPHFTIDHYLDERRRAQDLLWPTVRPLPGVLKLVTHLYKHKIPIAVATGSQRRNYDQKSSHLMNDLFGLFQGKVVCADDGLVGKGKGKPNPDIFLVAATKMLGKDVGEGDDIQAGMMDAQRMERRKGLVFEDAILGVQAGKRAGMNVVWVPDANLLQIGETGIPTAEQPDQTLRSLEDFVPEEWGLPPYEPESEVD